MRACHTLAWDNDPVLDLLDDRLSDHLRSRFLGDDDLLTELVADESARARPIHLNPDTARLVEVLLAAAGARRVLEVGTLFGYSAIRMARALGDGGHIDTVEADADNADAAQRWLERAGVAGRVTIHRGAALEVLPRLDGPYDAALLDAAKDEYPAYLEHALRMVRGGGLVLADNVLWGRRLADPSVDDEGIRGIRTYVDRVASDPRLMSTLVTVGDGLAVSVIRG